MGIQDIDGMLRQFEYLVQDLSLKYEGKQSSRVLANSIWMVDFIEEKVKKSLNPLIRELDALQSQSQNAVIQNNAMISKGHIQEIIKAIDQILFPYKNRYDFPQIESAFRANLPIITDKAKSLRHRIDIITNTTSSKKKIQDEAWYSNL